MFYLKTRLNDETTITTEITPDNVYTRCDVCGREVQVDLYAMLTDDDDDIEEPDCLCCHCYRKLCSGCCREG